MDRKVAAVSGATLRGWTPIRVYRGAEGAMVDCASLGDIRFTESFFEQTVVRALWTPARMLFRRQVPVAALEEHARECPGMRPAGLVFHLSRCGSTLLTQMWSALPRTLVLSEPPPVDHVLCAEAHQFGADRAQRLAWVRAMVSALGQPRPGVTEYYIKLDSWHILELPVLLEAFPDVPWIFLYREPLDIMLSHHRQRGTQAIPGALPPAVLGLDPPWAPPETLDAYTARVLAKLCEAAVRFAKHGRGRLVHYNELPGLMSTLCAGHFGVHYTAAELAQMHATTQFHAKAPQQFFADETTPRRQAAPPEVAELTERWLAGPYAQLEAIRAAQPPLAGAV